MSSQTHSPQKAPIIPSHPIPIPSQTTHTHLLSPSISPLFPPTKEKFKSILSTYGRANILIVSNSSGTHAKDPEGLAADLLETNTGVTVLRHRLEKPGCGDEIMAYFARKQQQQPRQRTVHQQMQNSDVVHATPIPRASASTTNEASGEAEAEQTPNPNPITHPSQIVVIGDRLFTDVVMANMMGARAIWIKEGAVRDHGFVTKMEYAVEGWLRRRGWSARDVVWGGR